MEKYKVTIREEFFKKTLKAEVEAEDKAEAINKVKRIYAEDLGTSKDKIEIKEVKKL